VFLSFYLVFSSVFGFNGTVVEKGRYAPLERNGYFSMVWCVYAEEGLSAGKKKSKNVLPRRLQEKAQIKTA
jgi:hypothetical protein